MARVDTLLAVARNIESKKEIDARVAFDVYGDSIAIFPSWEKVRDLEEMKVPVAMVALEPGWHTLGALKAIAQALEAIGEL
jgi:hypothetical protein